MDRREFLNKVGISFGAIALANSMIGCNKSDVATPGNVDFTLDLSTSAYSALKVNGGYTVYNGVVVARTLSGTYIAVSAACTHEGQTVQYIASGNYFYCSRHGAKFNSNGAVTQGPASTSLAQYKTSLNGNSLRVYS